MRTPVQNADRIPALEVNLDKSGSDKTGSPGYGDVQPNLALKKA
jgi:hypothetical protein